MARSTLLLLSVLPLALVACGRKAPAAEAESKASPAASASASAEEKVETSACPPAPSWAAELPSEVVVEVLHIPAKRANRNGAGYRLFEDGKLDTYTDVELFVNAAGKLDTRPGDAVWKTTGTPESSKLEAAQRLFAETSREDLEAWAPKKRPKELTSEWTLLRIRKDGELVSTCYIGHRAPPPLAALERAVHDLRGSIKSAEKAAKEVEKAGVEQPAKKGPAKRP